MAYSQGPHTLTITARLFAENRIRLVKALRGVVSPGSVVLLQGGIGSGRYNTDADDLPFRQVGVFKLDLSGVVFLLDIWSSRERGVGCSGH